MGKYVYVNILHTSMSITKTIIKTKNNFGELTLASRNVNLYIKICLYYQQQ